MNESITIEIDLETHKMIEAERKSFSESSAEILRRLLDLEPRVTPEIKLSSNRGLDLGDDVFLPEGTLLKKRFKGNLYEISVKHGKIWFNGKGYTSASGAAVAVAGNSVNGWIFWEVKRPDDIGYGLLDDLRRKNS